MATRATEAPLVLALDLGTSSVRGALYDAEARALEATRAERGHAPRTTADGGAEFDAEALLGATGEVVDAVLAAAGPRARDVRAVGLATFWHGVLGADASGRAVTPLLIWADTRATAHAAALARRLDARALHARTGCPLHPSFLPAKLAWIAEAWPGAWAASRWWGSFGEWLHRRLFRRADAPASRSMASGSGLLDQRADRWDAEVLAAIGLDAARLSPLGELRDASVGLTREWAARWPALAGVPWVPAVGDGAAGQIGSGCLAPDRLALNVGTSSALRVLVRGPSVPPPEGLFGYRLDRRDGVVGGALNEGGNVVAWLRAALRLPPAEEADGALDAMPPDAHGLTMLPFLAGERAPGWRGGLRGAVAGLSLDTTPLDLLRAAMEAVALRLARVADSLERLAPPEAPIVAAGGAILASSAWRRIVADALGRPVVASGEPEASERGAALVALRESGLLPSFDLAPARLGPRVDPDTARHAAYRAALERQQGLDDRLFAPRGERPPPAEDGDMAIGQRAGEAAASEPLAINTIRTLAMDAVQKANSGHPGMPMGAAPMAYVLWTRHLRHSPANPRWPGRDRFVLSAGHGSMLLYALLHLTGYDLPLDELERFRQWQSKTPGHPEHGLTPGVETTTGPLGQGISNAVGMAMGETILAARFNRPGHSVVDYRIYVIASDGDMMEGVASEAASLAGHLRLGRLVVLYDDNHISIEGNTELAFSEDVGQRFEAYGWHVQRIADGNDTGAIDRAIAAAKADPRPSLVCVRTHIAYGSPNKQDTAEAHGAPLGKDEVALTKRALGWPEEPAFFIPEAALAAFREAVPRGRELEAEWRRRFDAYARAHAALAAEWTRTMKGELPEGWTAALPSFSAKDPAMATREASGKVLNAVAPELPELMGGSADLAPSTNTLIKGGGDYAAGRYGGRNLHFGVREHAMGAIANGLALTGGIIPYTATFLIFSDYMRPPMRLAALMDQRVVFVFTHDSIGLGEDGPTHQPVEQLAALRAVPNLVVIRPADATETVGAWRAALERRHGPTAIALTRQKLPVYEGSSVEGTLKGGYVLAEAEGGKPEVLLLSTGSEVEIAVKARAELTGAGIRARVVSLPSFALFEAQPEAYRASVLPPEVTARVAVEAASPFGWDRYVGLGGAVVGLTRFGASAPYQAIYEGLGLTPAAVAARAKALLGRAR